MSAFITSPNHIDAILTFAKENNIKFTPHFDSLDAVGQYLVNENYRSVNYRYGEHKKPPKYIFRPYPRPLTSIEIIKTLHCLDYQCCELKKNSPRYNLIYKQILDYATYKIVHNLPEYQNAAWSID